MAGFGVRIVKMAVCGVLTLGAAAFAADQPAAGDQKKEIEVLLLQLGSPDENVRKAAQDKLINMGDEARTALETYIRTRAAAEAALNKIDTNKVAGPSLVTLDLMDVTPEQAFAELGKQTGYDIHPYNEQVWQQANLEKLTFKAEKQPFWSAMREICSRSGVTLYNSGGSERRLMLMQAAQVGQNVMKYPAVVDGAFMIAVTNLQRTNSVDLANPANVMRNMSMQMQLWIEPKVKVVKYNYQPEMEEAVDEKGNSLLGTGPSRVRYAGGYSSQRGLTFSMSIPLIYPADAGQKIVKLRGKVKMEIQTRSETLEIQDVMTAKDVTKTVAGRKVVLKEVKKTNDRQYQAHVIFYRENMEQQAFYELVNNPAIRLQDESGREYQYNGANSSSGNGETYEMRMMFYRRGPMRPGDAEPGEPTALMWDIPTATQEVTVPFEFTDLPLP